MRTMQVSYLCCYVFVTQLNKSTRKTKTKVSSCTEYRGKANLVCRFTHNAFAVQFILIFVELDTCSMSPDEACGPLFSQLATWNKTVYVNDDVVWKLSNFTAASRLFLLWVFSSTSQLQSAAKYRRRTRKKVAKPCWSFYRKQDRLFILENPDTS